MLFIKIQDFYRSTNAGCARLYIWHPVYEVNVINSDYIQELGRKILLLYILMNLGVFCSTKKTFYTSISDKHVYYCLNMLLY